MKEKLLTFQSYGKHRREIGICGRAMLIIEHREPKNRRMFGAYQYWQVWWGYLKTKPRWVGWIWLHSYCITLEWGITCTHFYAKLSRSIF